MPIPFKILLILGGLLRHSAARQVDISVSAAKVLGDLPPVARFFGCDEPNYATYPDGRALLSHLGSLGPHQTYFRTHNLLTTCDPSSDTTPIASNGAVPTRTPKTKMNGVKPYVQTGFMPKALSAHPDPYSFEFDGGSNANNIFTGWTNPPTSWQKWGELIFQWAKHCVERYGAAEVESWYWEVWNEPNIAYWNGTEEEYFMLYDYAVDGLLRALPSATVGGPEVAVNAVTNATGSPIDFISFHAKGSPIFINATASVPGHLQMNMATSLQNVDDAFSVIQSFDALNHLPVFIGEDDPDSCAACVSPNVEYRNGLIYPSYTAATFTRQIDLAVRHSVNLTGALTWAFEYDEHPYSTTLGRIVRASAPRRCARKQCEGGVVRCGRPGIHVCEGDKLVLMIWNYHDDALPKPDADISLHILDVFPRRAAVGLTHYRIDESHSNAFSVWQELGSPQDPTQEQIAGLKADGMLQMLQPPSRLKVDHGVVEVKFELPIHAVSLLVIE
ncbi:xylan 1,4-beta-xylosidase [Mycena leptocephala]|nr:xylan 1,4-beta-xylosidase [Mycena leptocephala]